MLLSHTQQKTQKQLGSISPTFYRQLLRQNVLEAKKVQTDNVSKVNKVVQKKTFLQKSYT
jgi:hypothetical protein